MTSPRESRVPSSTPSDAAEVIELGESVVPAAVMGSRRDRWMVPTAIGTAVVILVAGIVLASRPDLAIVAASPSVSPSDGIALASPSASPRPTRFIASPPPCLQGDGSTNADLTVRSGNLTWYPGITFDQTSIPPDPPQDWVETIAQIQGNDPSGAWRVASGDTITVVSTAARCLASWRAAFVKLDNPGALTVTPSDGIVSPAGSAATLHPPGPGDWLVWIAVEMPAPGSTRWIGTMGRLLVGADSIPPVPDVLPAMACGSQATPPDVALFDDEVPVPGIDPGTIGGPIKTKPTIVPAGARVEVRIAGDRCATTWELHGIARDPQGDQDLMEVRVYRTTTPDLAIAAQNRFPINLLQGPSGTWDIWGTWTFPDGTTISRAWSITFEELVVPPLLVGREGVITRVKAWVGCGLSVQYPNGNYSGGDSCGSNLPGQILDTVVVPAGSRLTFEVDGWTILDWGASAGRIVGEAGDPPNFEPIEGAFLRGATSPPVDFPAPRAGATAIQIWATLVRNGLTLNGSWYVLVDVR